MSELNDNQRMHLHCVELWNCVNAFEFECPRYWDTLTETDKETVRYCEECKENVFLCETPADFVTHGEQGHCVAISNECVPHQLFKKHFRGRPSKAACEEMRKRVQDAQKWWKEVIDLNPQFAKGAIAEVDRVLNRRPLEK